MKFTQRMTRRKGRKRSEAGIATAEMALVSPLLLLMFVVTADFGRVFYTAIALSNAARAGAQFGSYSVAQTGNTAGMNQAANLEAQDIGGGVTVSSQRFCKCSNGSSVNCTTGTCTGYGPPQVFVQVTASKTFTTLLSYPGVPNTLPLSRTAIMRAQ